MRPRRTTPREDVERIKRRDQIEAEIKNPILRSDFKRGKVDVVNPDAATLLFKTNHPPRHDHPDRARVRHLSPFQKKNRG